MSEQQQQLAAGETEVMTIRVIRKPDGSYRSAQAVTMPQGLPATAIAQACAIATIGADFITRRFFENLAATGNQTELSNALQAFRATRGMTPNADKSSMREAFSEMPTPKTEGGAP